MGERFLWGPHKQFFYSLGYEFQHRYPDLARNNGFYPSVMEDGAPASGPLSAFMHHGRAFPRLPDGRPQLHNRYAFHIENKSLVAWLQTTAKALGVEILDATVTPKRGDQGIGALVDGTGKRWTADLHNDASGFRSEILGRTLQECGQSLRGQRSCFLTNPMGMDGQTDARTHGG